MSTSVLTDLRKYDGSSGTQRTATRPGEDERGVWWGTASGVPASAATGGWTSRFAYAMPARRGGSRTAAFGANPVPGQAQALPEAAVAVGA
ncbi:hypothetical protein ACIBK8_33295 [Streptomyces sp. NPDC050161]|uniref:hypothetical protein n=1 Tax=Streptomyces sp. NPDC050161 TaxID=3365604 RepID=UPI0037947B92